MSAYPPQLNYSPLLDANKLSGVKDSLTVGTSNGTTFQMNQPMEITVPMNQPGHVCDFKNCRVSLKINNGTGGAITFQSRVGSLGLINQQLIKTSTGKEFSNFDQYNVLMPLLIEKEVDPDWYDYNGNFLFGCTNEADGDGDTIANTESAIKMLPLQLTGVSHPFFPMDSIADIVIRLKLETVDTCFALALTKANSLVTITDVVFHYDVYDLSDSLTSAMNVKLGGNYVLDVLDWAHQQRSLNAGVLKFTDEIGFAKKKAKRLIMVVRTTSDIVAPTAKGLMSRTQAGITKVVCYLNNKTYQSSSGVEMVSASNMVDAYAELLKNSGGLFDMKTNSISLARYSLITGATIPTTLALSGAYFYEISFENGMDTDISSSGVEINHNNLKISVEKATSGEALTIDYFVEFENKYIMNKSQRVWEVSDTGVYQS